MAAGLAVAPVNACVLCGNEESIPLFSQPDAFVVGGFLHITRCPQCTLVYLNPRLTLSSVHLLESESTVYDFSPEVAEERIRILKQMLSFLEQFGPRRGRLLDIGSNRGLLLEAGRRLGWIVVGIEPSPVAAERARNDLGLAVYQDLDAVAHLEPFDLIVAWHVLEHTPDPVAFLRQAAGALNTDGTLAIQVPSFDFLEEFRRRSEIVKLVCAVHNFYFTEESIRAVLACAGLYPLWIHNSSDDLNLTVVCSKNQPH